MQEGDVDTAEEEDETSIGFEFDLGKYGCTQHELQLDDEDDEDEDNEDTEAVSP